MIFHIYKFLSNPILAPSQVGQVTQQRGLRGLEAPIRTSEATVGGVVVFRWFFDSNEKWNMGVPQMGVPRNHSFIDGFSLINPSSYWDTPIYGNPLRN
jgi:hypothetical protein